jgi:Ca2+-binding RTX toxin-like protein
MAGTRISSNNARGTSGSAYAIFGKGSPDLVDTAALGAAGFRVDGAAAGDQAGTSVGTLEDANGDTRAELVVGSPRADANGRAESGSVHIVFGKSSSDTVDLATLGSAGRRIDGPAAAGMYATSSAGAGDVNRDGRGELLAGAPVIGGGAGAAYLTLGRATTSVVLAGAGTKTWTLAGAAADDAVGETESVASAGDVDGDGRDDVIVAARKADSNGRGDSGSAYILLGPSPLAGRCANPLLGTSTKDRLNGTKAGDRIKGLAKKDRLKGKSGKDCLIGGGGNDFLKGGKGKDRHKGGAGNDLIDSRDGRRGDRINCGAGKRDRVKADRGDRVARNCERVRRA